MREPHLDLKNISIDLKHIVSHYQATGGRIVSWMDAHNKFVFEEKPERYSALKDQLEDKIHQIPELNIFNGQIVDLFNGGTRVEYENLIESLIIRSIQVGVHKAIEELEYYLTHYDFPCRKMLLIGGIVVPTSINLSEGIVLAPFSGFDSKNFDYIPGAQSPIVDPTARNNITAALISDFNFPRSHRNENEPNPTINNNSHDMTKLEEAFNCLTLIGPSGPGILATSIMPMIWRPAGSHSAIGQCPFPTELRSHHIFNATDCQRLQQIHQQYVALPLSTRNHLRVPLRRLNLAMRRYWDVDTAIDLGIAMETLVVEKTNDSTIGFMLRLRVARLLGNNINERKIIAKQIQRLYDLRSKAAHTGVLPNTIQNISSSTVLQQGAELVSSIIEHFILNDQPDWDNIIYG